MNFDHSVSNTFVRIRPLIARRPGNFALGCSIVTNFSNSGCSTTRNEQLVANMNLPTWISNPSPWAEINKQTKNRQDHHTDGGPPKGSVVCLAFFAAGAELLSHNPFFNNSAQDSAWSFNR